MRPEFNAKAKLQYNTSAALLALSSHNDLRAYDIGISAEAGAYLCEYMSYRVLEKVEGTQTKAMFVLISNENKDAKKQFVQDLTTLCC